MGQCVAFCHAPNIQAATALHDLSSHNCLPPRQFNNRTCCTVLSEVTDSDFATCPVEALPWRTLPPCLPALTAALPCFTASCHAVGGQHTAPTPHTKVTVLKVFLLVPSVCCWLHPKCDRQRVNRHSPVDTTPNRVTPRTSGASEPYPGRAKMAGYATYLCAG